MAYTDTPQGTQAINATQPLIRQNFVELQTTVSANHVAIGAANTGKHSKVDIINSATHPAVVGTDVLLYNFANVLTTQQELYVKRVGALATEGIPFTAKGGTTTGWSYLPSGLLIKWGYSLLATVAGEATYTFPVGATIPAFTAVYAVITTHANTAAPASINSAVTLRDFTTLQFRVYCTQRTTTTAITNVPMYYLAIGV